MPAGGVSRMSDPEMIEEIKRAVTIPVMAKCRIGHFVEAQIIEHIQADFIDESEVLTVADDLHHIDKHAFKTPFVCGCRDLGEALRRISEGASMIRTKGEAGTGDIVEAVRHARLLRSQIASVQGLSEQEQYHYAKTIGAPVELVRETARLGRLPVVTFAAGGIATPADAALMMHLGMDGVFVGSVALEASPADQHAGNLQERPSARARKGRRRRRHELQQPRRPRPGQPQPRRGNGWDQRHSPADRGQIQHPRHLVSGLSESSCSTH